ncbi:MAG TPA: hypothetical protein VF054_21430 [Micromonosporaceae bacterium]
MGLPPGALLGRGLPPGRATDPVVPGGSLYQHVVKDQPGAGGVVAVLRRKVRGTRLDRRGRDDHRVGVWHG